MSQLRLVLVSAIVTLGLASTAAHAQPAPAQRTIGVDGVVVLPLGDYADLATLAFGALGRVEFPVGHKLSVTGRAGVLYHLLDSDVDGSLWFVPVYGGVRYGFGAGPDGFYVAGELGITFGFASVDTGVGTASDSDSELGMTLGGGMRRGALDIRAALFLPDVGEDPGVMGSVGYDFASF
jgi:hypothetical protein